MVLFCCNVGGSDLKLKPTATGPHNEVLYQKYLCVVYYNKFNNFGWTASRPHGHVDMSPI